MTSQENEKATVREIRRKRMNFRLARLKKQWKIFYSSPYGKAGFYIILILAIIAAISPAIQLQSNPSSYVAPSIDTTVPKLLSENFAGNISLDSSQISSYGSSITITGSNWVYSVNENGKVVALQLATPSSTTTGKLASVANLSLSSSPESMSVFTLIEGANAVTGTETMANYMLISTHSGQIVLARISDLTSSGALTTPKVVSTENLSLGSNFALPPISTVLPVDQPSIPSIPYYSSSILGASSNVGRIIAVTENSSGLHLLVIDDSSLKISSQRNLPFSNVSGLYFYGSYFPSSGSQLAILTSGNSVYAYHLNGTLAWVSKIPGMNFTGQVQIPLAYQRSVAPYNSILAVGENSTSSSVFRIFTSNGTSSMIFTLPSRISSISSSYGSTGFPSSVIVISGTEGYVLNGPDHILGKVSLASGVGAYSYKPVYDPSSNTYIISSTDGALYSLSGSLGTNPFYWGMLPKSAMKGITQPELILNAATGTESITFRGGDGYIYVYSASGVSINPIPPTFHTPSGNIFPLGTNSEGNDVWSQFIGSFPPDWVVGIAVGLIGIIVAIIFGMIIGYYRGFISVAVDTITLVIYLIPGLALLIALTSVLKPSLTNIILVLSFTAWPFTTFTILGIIRSVKQRTFVDAARVSGAGTLQILRRHMMPNITPLLIYLTSISISGAVGAIATLQFLGIAPLTILTWGGMLNPLYDNYYLAAVAPWWVLPPTVALTLFVMGFIFLSRGVDELVNPRLRRR
ncbi:MAG: ABC transporter permease [Thermoplasmatales archaeon]